MEDGQPRKRLSQSVRRALAVFKRDDWHCKLCGRQTPSHLRGLPVPDAPTVDHITPKAEGGSNRQENLQCACRDCNLWKANRTDVTVRATFSRRDGPAIKHNPGKRR